MSERAHERARRLGGAAGTPVIDELKQGNTARDAAGRLRLPVAHVEGVRTFYDYLRQPSKNRVCRGTACSFPNGKAPTNAPAAGTAVRCLGRCYDPPATTEREPAPIPRRALGPAAVLSEIVGEASSLDDLYQSRRPEAVLAAIEASGLRGRGGASFPVVDKWRSAAAVAGPRYVVANGDEGDPGSFIDRLLMEEAPHAVLAGAVACARAIGADRVVAYVRAEYDLAARRLEQAASQAHAGGHSRGIDIEIHRGAGSYVCGEETALLRSLEGLRGEAATRPPYPTQSGLHGRPTVVQNVETLALVPWILRNNTAPPGTAFSVSGAVNQPGIIEAPWGTTLIDVLEAAGGVPTGIQWSMALVGGPMGCVIPSQRFAVTLDPETLPRLGHGGIVVLDHSVEPSALARHLMAFARAESCGACAPCRIGSAHLSAMTDEDSLERLLHTMTTGSLCGFGRGVAGPIGDLLEHFPGAVISEVTR